MNKPPAFQFYVEEWLSSFDIRTMSRSQELGYFRLLLHQWDSPTCKLPRDDKKLAIMARMNPKEWISFKKVITKKFIMNGNNIYNEKLHNQWAKLQENRKAFSNAGKEAMRKRWNNKEIKRKVVSMESDKVAISRLLGGNNTPSPSPSPSPPLNNNTPPPPKRGEGEALFLAKLYVSVNKGPTDRIRDAQKWFQSAIDKGVDPQEIEKVIYDPVRMKGFQAWEVAKELEKEKRTKSARPKIFRASDEPKREYPPEIKKMLAEATKKLTLHPEKPNADQPEPSEKPN
jgi:uncharacterized protein YdaU (DUF1376 family)